MSSDFFVRLLPVSDLYIVVERGVEVIRHDIALVEPIVAFHRSQQLIQELLLLTFVVTVNMINVHVNSIFTGIERQLTFFHLNDQSRMMIDTDSALHAILFQHSLDRGDTGCFHFLRDIRHIKNLSVRSSCLYHNRSED
jgi:hypothetical protein